MSIATVKAFAAACKTLNSDQVYELFENEISYELRKEIYNTYASLGSNEPVREALNAIGTKFNVQSLIDY
jgi:hypothetical protein